MVYILYLFSQNYELTVDMFNDNLILYIITNVTKSFDHIEL